MGDCVQLIRAPVLVGLVERGKICGLLNHPCLSAPTVLHARCKSVVDHHRHVLGLGLSVNLDLWLGFSCDQMQEDSVLTIQNPIEIKARFGCTFIIFQFLFS